MGVLGTYDGTQLTNSLCTKQSSFCVYRRALRKSNTRARTKNSAATNVLKLEYSKFWKRKLLQENPLNITNDYQSDFDLGVLHSR